MAKTILEVQKITKDFGKFRAVDNLSFSVDRGEVFGFLGPNGAGKTTTMKMITNFIPSTSGKIFINGKDSKSNDLTMRKNIGYLPETTPLYTEMLVNEYLKYVAKLRGVASKEIKLAVSKMVDKCGLQGMEKRAIANLSKGYRQRVGLAQAMIHEPDLLILDEPMSGLDPNQIIEIRELIKSIGKEKTVIYCSHILSEVSATCNRVMIVNNGERVALGTPKEVIQQSQGHREYNVTLKLADADKVKSEFSIPSIIKLDIKKVSDLLDVTVSSSKDEDLSELFFDIAVKNGWKILALNGVVTTLEDVFTTLTGDNNG